MKTSVSRAKGAAPTPPSEFRLWLGLLGFALRYPFFTLRRARLFFILLFLK